MRAVAFAVLVVTAGCLGGSDGAADAVADAGDPDSEDNMVAPTVGPLVAELPVWQVGDWWRYDVEHVSLGLSFSYEVVVARADASGYLLAGTDEEGAIIALFTHYPPIGPVSTQLDHFMHGEPVSFFRFPMRAGDSWDADYRGGSARYEVTDTSLRWGEPGLHVAAARDGGPFLEYDWSPVARYFAALRFTFEPDGTWDHTMELTGWGNAYGQPVVARWVEDVLHAESAPGGVPGVLNSANTGQFTVVEGPSSVLLGMFGGGPGTRDARFLSPGGQLYDVRQDASDDAQLVVARADPEPGTWNFAATAQDGFYFIEGYALYEEEVAV